MDEISNNKSNLEALDWRKSTATVRLCSATNHYKSNGTKKKRAKALRREKWI